MKRARFMISVFAYAAVGIFLSANRMHAAVGLCVKDYSISNIRAVNTSDTASGWDGERGYVWTARSTNGLYTVEGVAACLNTGTKNGAIPSTWIEGGGCWCKVAGINNRNASGAWIFGNGYSNVTTCASDCAILCTTCVRQGAHLSCTRSAMFTLF